MKKIKILFQYLIPQKFLTRCLGILSNCEKPIFLKHWAIKFFIQYYHVDMTEALEPNYKQYKHFNDFFTRALKPDARTIIPAKEGIASPVDGNISQLGVIQHDRLFQAKGHEYTLNDLLAKNNERAEQFIDGNFITLYLSPKDYHRVHMPIEGYLKETCYVPGKLFSVNPLSVNHIPGLFALNERLISYFDTAIGPVAVIMVGAMIVASIETVWAGTIQRSPYIVNSTIDKNISLKQGDEMGRFKLGSTVILLFGRNQIQWLERLAAGKSIQLGEQLASPRKPTHHSMKQE